MTFPLVWNDGPVVGEVGELLLPRSLKNKDTESYALRIPLNYEDPQSLTLAKWDKVTQKITCSDDPFTVTAIDCTMVDIAYDQINRLNAAWIAADNLYLYWFDTVTLTFVTTNFGAVDQAFFMMDDCRHHSQSHSTLMLFYRKGLELYYRIQADRFAIEYHIDTLREDTYVRYIGLTDKNRIQIAIGNSPLEDIFDQIIVVDTAYVAVGDLYVGDNF